MNIKIIVATHKQYRMPSDSAYMPLHVGKNGDKSIGYDGDDTGENISEKNANYCELTGLYWAWKNLDADVIGLVHYRRHFMSPFRGGSKWERVINGAEVEKILQNHDIIVPCKRNYIVETNESQYIHAHGSDCWNLMCKTICSDHAAYVPALDKVRKFTSGHKFNMFIMKRQALDDYCSWLFSILEKIEEGWLEKNRILGHISERMFDVWLYSNENKYKYTEIPVKFMEQQNWLVKGGKFLMRKFFPPRIGADAV